MTLVSDAENADFFAAVEEASKKAIWCAVATADSDGPRVRIVHPTWEDRALWFATGTTSPKIAQIRRQPAVDVQFQVAPPDFVHVLAGGSIVRSGGKELALELEEKGYGWLGGDAETAASGAAAP